LRRSVDIADDGSAAARFKFDIERLAGLLDDEPGSGSDHVIGVAGGEPAGHCLSLSVQAPDDQRSDLVSSGTLTVTGRLGVDVGIPRDLPPNYIPGNVSTTRLWPFAGATTVLLSSGVFASLMWPSRR
jgi:hypothetical protein